jgi:hypothetical protein
MDIKVFLVSGVKRSGEMIDFFLYRFIMHLPNIYMQLRCSTGLSGDYITSLHVIFFKIYDKNVIYALFMK